MNNKDAIKGERFTASDGNTYVMLNTGRIQKVEMDDDGDEEYTDVTPVLQIRLRAEFKSRQQ